MTDTRGAAALMLVLVLTAFVVLLMSGVMLRGVDDLEIGFSQQMSFAVMQSAESCVEEAFLRLQRDSAYTGGVVNVGEAACTIAITGTPCGTCVIAVDATAHQLTRSLEIGVDVTGSSIDITSWEEK
jgi:hypothetical protein